MARRGGGLPSAGILVSLIMAGAVVNLVSESEQLSLHVGRWKSDSQHAGVVQNHYLRSPKM